ncbi:MAG: leucine-rich repeat protein [Prevotella sp.]|nr:leucine-rich repeat protein [Prevotella sp.]
MKRFAFSFLIMTLPLLTWADKSGTTGDCQWIFTTSDSKLTISGKGVMEDYYFMHYSPWDSYANSIIKGEIREGVTNIGSYTFRNCTNLSEVKIANSVETIGKMAFYNCPSLQSIVIPEGVSYIDYRTFRNCTSLSTVYLPGSLTSMNDDAFGNCPLATVYCSATTVPTVEGESSNNFNSLSENSTLYVPASAIEDYKDTAPWNNFANIVAIPKCATPTITYENGKLSYTCDTEGVTFITHIAPSDGGMFATSEVSLSLAYTVSVYASKMGYENSDAATMTIQLSNAAIRGDVNGDGKVNITDATEVVGIILNP